MYREYRDASLPVQGWIEQLFAHLWHWGLVRNIWCAGPNELHQSVRISCTLHNFVNQEPGLSHTPTILAHANCTPFFHLST